MTQKNLLSISYKRITQFLGSLHAAPAPRTDGVAELHELEPRILYDASPLGVLLDTVGDDAHEPELIDLSANDAIPEIEDFAYAPEPEGYGLYQGATEVVFIDRQVEDYERLVGDLINQPNVAIFLLDESVDGVAQISQTLQGFTQVSAIHLVSHGSDNSFQVGASNVSLDNFHQFSSEFSQWGNVLTADADLLIYGCNVAGSDDGRALIETLESITGADVAASDDLTGDQTQGGDWNLEFVVGDVESEIIFSHQIQTTWAHTLDTTTGLSAHYEFEDGSGLTASDSISTNDGTLLDSPSWGQGIVGDGAIDFSGDFDRVDVADNSTLDFGTGNFTVSFWLNSTDLPASIGRILGQSNGSDGFVFLANNDGSLTFSVYGSLTSTSLTDTGILDGNWHHVSAVRTGDLFQLYVDGTLRDSATVAVGTVLSADPLRLGSHDSSTNEFDGYIDDLRIYSRGLTSTDVGELKAMANSTIYASSNSTDNTFESISNVTFVGLNNSSGMDTNGYGNFTNLSADVTLGESNDLSVTISPDSDNYVTVWIDWNQDGDFLDSSESYVVVTGTAVAGPHTISVSTPTDALLGTTRMRVTLDYTNTPVSEGTFTYGEVEDYTINVSAESTHDLWLSSQGDVSSSGVTGLDSWSQGEVLHFGGPMFSLDPTGTPANTTSGSLSSKLNLDSLVLDGNANINAVHYVSTAQRVGNSGGGSDSFDLALGDVILSTDQAETLVGTNGNLSISANDVFVYRPASAGDYSSGEFYLLIDGTQLAGVSDITGISLVEQNVSVGDSTLNAGTFLFTHSSGTAGIQHFTATGVGSGTDTQGSVTTLIESADIGLDGTLEGIELIESNVILGGTTVTQGSILVTQSVADAAAGNNSIATNPQDIVQLTISKTEWDQVTTVANATLLLDGSDVSLDSTQEQLDGLTLRSYNVAPTITSNGGGVNDSISQNENVTSVTTVVATDTDLPAQTLTYSISGGVDASFFTIDASSGVLTWLDGPDYENALDSDSDNTYEVTVQVSDNQGGTDRQNLSVTVQDVDDTGPTQTVPGPQSTDEDTTLTFSSGNGNAIVVDDGTAATDQRVQVWLGVQGANGTITLSQTTGLDFAAGSNGSSSMVLWGTESDINSALEGAIFTPTGDYSGSVTLQVETKLAADLEGFYEFEDSGFPGTDTSTGVTQYATKYGDPTHVSDPDRGYVVDFDGAGDYLQITGEFGQPPSLTLSTWVNADNGYADLISIENRVILRLDDPNNGGNVTAIYHDGTTYHTAASTQALAGDGWHHIAMTFDDATKTMTLYIDGVQAAQNTFTNSISYVGGDTYLGSNSGGSLFLDGKLDDVRIYTRSLDGAEIASLSNDIHRTFDTVAITVNPVNDQPGFNNLDNSPTFTEGGSPVVLDGDVQLDDTELSAADNYSGSTFTLTRNGGSNSNDVFSATGTILAMNQGSDLNVGGVAIGSVDVNSGGTLQVTFYPAASQSLVNDFLSQIAYANSNDNPPGSIQLDWTFDDGNTGSQGSGGGLSQTVTQTVNITATNDAPIVDTSGDLVFDPISEDIGTGSAGNTIAEIIASTGGDRITDPDSGAVEGIAVTGVDNTNGTWFYTTDDVTWWSLSFRGVSTTGASDSSAVLLDASARIRFVPNSDYNGSAGSIHFRAWDQTSGNNGDFGVNTSVHGGTSAFSSATETASIQVTAVNDSPTVGSGFVPSVAEETTNPPGETVSNLFSGSFNDIDSGSSMSGILVTNNPLNASEGDWQYSTDSGSNWYSIGSVSAPASLALDTTTLIRFVPAADFTGSPAGLSLRALDDTYSAGFTVGATKVTHNSSSPGGTSAISSSLESINTTITAVNDQAVLDLNGSGPAGTDYSTSFTEDGSPAYVTDSNATLSDADHTTYDRLTIDLSGAFVGSHEKITIGGYTFDYGVGETQTRTVGATSFDIVFDGTQFVITQTDTSPAPESDLLALIQGIQYENQSDAPVVGIRQFDFTVRDAGGLDSAVAVSSITVNPQNDVPVASDDSYAVDEGATLNINALSGVLANDSDADGDTLTVSLLSGPSNGSLTLNADGSFDYTHNGSESTADAFTYQVDDGNGGLHSATVNLTINPVNDAPVAVDDNSYSLDEAATLNINALSGVLANDSDAEGDSLTVSLLSGPSNGSLTLNADGSFDYTHNGSESTADAFTYQVDDGNGGLHSATVNLTINPVNDAPVAVDDNSYSLDEAATLNINALSGVLANDSDAEGDSLTVSLLSGPSNGSLTLNADGSFDYTHNGSESTADAFTYQIDDGNGGLHSATVNLTINPVNDTPVAVDDNSYSLDEAATLNINALSGVLANDSDADGDTLTVSLLSGPSNGSLTLNADGSFDYTHNGTETTADAFTYQVDDGNGGLHSATVNLTINPVNDAPVALDDNSYSLDEAATLNINALSGVLANDSDAEGDSLTVSLLSGPSNGSLTLNADGSFDYTHNGSESTADAFTYQVDDGNGGLHSATVNLTINPVNDAPVAMDDSYVVSEGSTINIDALSGVLANDSDAEGNSLTVSLLSGPSNGSLTLNPDGSFDYTHDGSETIADTFTYQVDDGNGGLHSATVNVTVSPGNDAPVATDDSYVVSEGSTLNVDALSGVLSNDTDAEGDTLTVSLLSGPSHGSLTLNADGSFDYTHDGSETISDSFTYQANDGNGGLHSATVHLTVTPVNDAPIALNDSYSVDEGGTLSRNTLSGVAFNDTDAEGDTLTISLLSGPANGSLTLNADGSFDYTHDGSETTADGFTYQVDDGNGGVHSATVSLTINPVNDVPVASDDYYLLDEGATLNIAPLSGVLSNDIDVDGDLLTVSLVSGPSHGSLTLNADGSFDYVHDGSETIADSFGYRVDDGNGGIHSATVYLTINPVNDAPTAADDTYTLDEGAVLNVNSSSGVLANDFDIDGPGPLTASIVAGPANGTLSLNPDGSFAYTHNGSETTSDSFTYQVTDGAGAVHTATVNLTVNPINDAPLASDDHYTLAEGATLLTDSVSGLLANDTDSEMDTLTTQLVSGPTHGTLTLLSDGTFTYTHDGSETLHDQFSYRVLDGNGGSGLAMVDLTIVPVNDAPIANDDSYVVDEEQTLIGDVVANDSDAEGNTLTTTLVSGPSHQQSLTLNSDGTFTYIPATDYFGPDSFTYQVDDGNGGVHTATVNIVINNVNDQPTSHQDAYIVISGDVLEATTSVLVNDTDMDGDPLIALLVTPPSNGTLTLRADGTFTYTANDLFIGTDTFTYVSNDGTINGTPVTVTIEVDTGLLASGLLDMVMGQSGPDDGGEMDTQSPTYTESDSDSDSETQENNAINVVNGTNRSQSSEESNSEQSFSLNLRQASESEFLSSDPESRHEMVILDEIANVHLSSRSMVQLSSYSTGSGIAEFERTVRTMNDSTIGLAYEAQLLWEKMDSLAQEVYESQTEFDMDVPISSITGMMATGYVLWLIRGGVLMATTLSQLPTWKMIDPLTVLDSFESQAPTIDDEVGNLFFDNASGA